MGKRDILRRIIGNDGCRNEGQPAFHDIQIGQDYPAIVTRTGRTSMTCAIGNVFGIVWSDEVTWEIMSDPRILFTCGQDVIVRVIDKDPVHKELTFSLKRFEPDPWITVPARYEVGDQVIGEVAYCGAGGYTVMLAPGVYGFFYDSQSRKRGDLLGGLEVKHIDEKRRYLFLENTQSVQNGGDEMNGHHRSLNESGPILIPKACYSISEIAAAVELTQAEVTRHLEERGWLFGPKVTKRRGGSHNQNNSQVSYAYDQARVIVTSLLNEFYNIQYNDPFGS